MKNLLAFLSVALLLSCSEKYKRVAIPERIQAFCIDFNWSGKGYAGLALPQDYNHADAKSQFEWYKDHGVNTIQSFCVSHNGYAWYDSKIAPKIPGLKGNFLKELVELGHKDSMLVMGYFSPCTNVHWRELNPDEVYNNNSMFHVIYTKKYLSYLGAVIREAIRETGIDGFMIDAIFAAPAEPDSDIEWKDCEKQMYEEFFAEKFPGVDKIDSLRCEEFLRRSMSRCWDTIYTAAKSVDPQTIIWVTCHDLQSPQLNDAKMLKQVDWLMNESFDPEKLKAVRQMTGEHTKLIQCVVGWGEQHNAKALFADDAFKDVGFYGFAWPDSVTVIPPTLETAGDDNRFMGNAKNIEAMKEFYLSK